jgi:hypothetical protein
MYTGYAAGGTMQEFNRGAVGLWGREPRRGDHAEKFCGAHKLYLPDGSVMPHAQTPVAAVRQGAIPFAQDVEVVMERPDASRITVIADIVPLKNAAGQITAAVNCLYAVTERSLLERKTREHAEALASLHRRKDELLAMRSTSCAARWRPLPTPCMCCGYRGTKICCSARRALLSNGRSGKCRIW